MDRTLSDTRRASTESLGEGNTQLQPTKTLHEATRQECCERCLRTRCRCVWRGTDASKDSAPC